MTTSLSYGQPVSVRARCAMPGVPDGEVIHTLWTPQTAALVDAGRFEILPQPPCHPRPNRRCPTPTRQRQRCDASDEPPGAADEAAPARRRRAS